MRTIIVLVIVTVLMSGCGGGRRRSPDGAGAGSGTSSQLRKGMTRQEVERMMGEMKSCQAAGADSQECTTAQGEKLKFTKGRLVQ